MAYTAGVMEMKTENQSGSVREFVMETVKFAILAALVVLPIRFFIAQPFIVKGESMDPTFGDGQYLIVDEISYYSGDPERGEVIIFKYPNDPSKYFIKRVVGLPGETVSIQNGRVTIRTKNLPAGFSLDESYVANASGESAVFSLGEDEYFVMGDNRRNSFDSRAWGVLPRKNIIGRAFARLLPVDQIGVFPGAVEKIEIERSAQK